VTTKPTGPEVSVNGSCGQPWGTTCTGSDFGICCSKEGKCGRAVLYCATRDGCQSDYGTCFDLPGLGNKTDTKSENGITLNEDVSGDNIRNQLRSLSGGSNRTSACKASRKRVRGSRWR